MGTVQRAKAAVALKISAAPYSAISAALGFATDAAAQNAVEYYLGATLSETRDVPHLRALTHERLERLLNSVWEKAAGAKAEDGADHLSYVRTALSLIDRQSRLNGVDAPQRLEISTPDSRDLQEWVIRMAEQVGPKGLEKEADIMDAEIVEDIISDNDIESANEPQP